MAKQKNVHIGGQQEPLFTPDSTWIPPSELPDLRHHRRIAVDIENRDEGLAAGRGSGWPFKAGHLCGVAVASPQGSIYVPVAHPDTECFDPNQVKRWLHDHFISSTRIVMHHAQHDVGWLRAEWGLQPPIFIDDTEAMAMVVDETRLQYNLDALCKWRGLPGKDEAQLREAAAAYGYANDVKSNYWRLPARYGGPYAEQDAAATLALADDLEPILDTEGTRDAYQLEVDLIPMVHEMRWRGIRVDTDLAARNRDAIIAKRDQTFYELAERLPDLPGAPHTGKVTMDEIGRVKWLEKVFDAAKISYPRTEKTGRGSFTAGSTGWMHKHPHWLPQLIVKADKYNNAASKFLQGSIIDYAHRGRIHASINQYRGEEGGTKTHRFSYSDPALQQMIGRDKELTPMIRDCFLPEEGELWLKPDYSQQEYRLNVHFSELLGLPKAKEAGDLYRNDPKADFHKMVSEWVDLERQPAKDVNFAKSYRAGIPKFAAMINKSIEHATTIYEHYDEELPFVSMLGQRCQSLAERRGYIRLLDGARLHFDRWEPTWREKGEQYEAPRLLEAAREKWPDAKLRRAFCYMSVNGLIQGSAARMTKLAMRAMWKERIVPLLQMHDAIDTSVDTEKKGKLVVDLMENAVKLTVPARVDAHYGRSWGNAKNSWEKRDAI